MKIKHRINPLNNPVLYNSTIFIKTPHDKSQELPNDHHNLSARTLETKGSFKNLKQKYMNKNRKRSVKRRMNQTIINDAKEDKNSGSSERSGQGPWFNQNKKNTSKAMISNVYQTNAQNLRSKGTMNFEKLTPSNRMQTSRYFKKSEKLNFVRGPNNLMDTNKTNDSNNMNNTKIIKGIPSNDTKKIS